MWFQFGYSLLFFAAAFLVAPVSYTHLDVYKRQEQQLLEMEERLGLARRFQEIQKALTLICDCALAIQDFNEQNGRVPGIDENAGKILECAQEISMEA